MRFISQKVEIRYLPEDMDSAFILYEGEHLQWQKEKDCFQSGDFKQMSSRLSYVRDVGVAVSLPQVLEWASLFASVALPKA